MKLVLYVSLFLWITVPAMAKPTIAVLDFNVVSKAIRMGPEFTSLTWSEEKSDILTSDTITALVNTRKFDVLERDRMGEVMQEKDFISMTQDQAIQLGSLLGTQYFVMGQIELIEANLNKRKIPYTERYRVDLTGRMSVNVRIVDTRGGKIVAAQKINQVHSNGGGSALVFLEELKERCVKQIVNNVVDGVFPVKVMNIDSTHIYLNRGAGSSFSVGSIMVIYKEGEALIDPDTGEKLGTTEEEVAKIKITEILEKFSKATLVSGDVTKVENGAICRKEIVLPEPTHKKPATPGSSEKPIQW